MGGLVEGFQKWSVSNNLIRVPEPETVYLLDWTWHWNYCEDDVAVAEVVLINFDGRFSDSGIGTGFFLLLNPCHYPRQTAISIPQSQNLSRRVVSRFAWDVLQVDYLVSIRSPARAHGQLSWTILTEQWEDVTWFSSLVLPAGALPLGNSQHTTFGIPKLTLSRSLCRRWLAWLQSSWGPKDQGNSCNAAGREWKRRGRGKRRSHKSSCCKGSKRPRG